MTLNSSNASCSGVNDGTITVSSSGGNQPYTIITVTVEVTA